MDNNTATRTGTKQMGTNSSKPSSRPNGKPERLFEVSWEVCNKVGGINTVIKSKAPFMIAQYGKGYTMIGPYFKEKADVELKKEPVPDRLKKVFETLKQKGVICHYGRWIIRDEPETILIDFSALIPKKNELRKKYWDEYQIDSLFAGWDFDEPMLFSTAVGMLIDEYARSSTTEETICGHFHEWMTGLALLYLKSAGSPVATVFTTHATMLGRSVAGSGYNLYDMLNLMNPDEWARRLNVQEKYTSEKACAQHCDIFTTVSEITAMEAEKLLGRKPEVLLFNGLSIAKFPTVEETSIKHVASREAIREFMAYYFFPYYSFELEHSLIYFITARFEYKNKGLDILTAALKRLNEELQRRNSDRTIVCFFWIPMGTTGVKKELIENKNLYYHIKNYVDWHAQTILKQITFEFLVQGVKEDRANNSENDTESNAYRNTEMIFTSEFMRDIKRDLQHFRRIGNPPICSHNLMNQDQNQLYTGLLAAGLDNKPDDRVKVIIYPAYLDGADSLLNLPYYEAIVGGHLGIFPSYYEPWGYTPLESAALGVPAITTDLAGFGRYVQQHQPKDAKGVFVQPRFGHKPDEEVESLFHYLLKYAEFDHVERVENRLAAKNISALADWKHFVKFYVRAHKMALQHMLARTKKKE